jgi:hypothetical protein
MPKAPVPLPHIPYRGSYPRISLDFPQKNLVDFLTPVSCSIPKISQIGTPVLSKSQCPPRVVLVVGVEYHGPRKTCIGSLRSHNCSLRSQGSPIQKMRSFSKLPPEWDAPRRGGSLQPRVAIVVEGGAPRAQLQYKKKVKVSPWSREIDGRQRARPIPHETAA